MMSIEKRESLLLSFGQGLSADQQIVKMLFNIIHHRKKNKGGLIHILHIGCILWYSCKKKRREWSFIYFITFTLFLGTPVNRIPIMAKQTLDLYELFRLVVSKGGLVEVINKKLWREITKGLNLPSSITSAAFTLRTQ